MIKKLCITAAILALTLILSTGVGAMYAGSLYFDFDDMGEWAWYYVDDAYECGYMFGVGDRDFAPKSEVTYAELVTVLYRIAGTPYVADPSTGDHKWYHLEMLWGEQNGIIELSGRSPENIASRDDIVRIIYNFADHMGIDVSSTEDTSVLDSFADKDAVPGDSKAQWSFAVSNEIIKGVGNNTLSPESSLTREQLAAIAMRIATNDTLKITENSLSSDVWEIPNGTTVITDAPVDAARTMFYVDIIANRYLIENKEGDYLCTTYDVNVTDSNPWNSCPYVYGTLPCYDAVYFLVTPFPSYVLSLPESDLYTIIPRYSTRIDISFMGVSLAGYGVEKLTFEGNTITLYGRRAAIRTTNVENTDFTLVFADK